MLSNRDAKRIFNAISAADGYPAEVTSDGRTSVIKKHYAIPAKGRVILARNHALLEPVITGLSKAHDDIIRQLTGTDDVTVLPPEHNAEFLRQWNALLDDDSQVELIRCGESAIIDEERCDLPPTVLADLLPLVLPKPSPEN